MTTRTHQCQAVNTARPDNAVDLVDSAPVVINVLVAARTQNAIDAVFDISHGMDITHDVDIGTSKRDDRGDVGRESLATRPNFPDLGARSRLIRGPLHVKKTSKIRVFPSPKCYLGYAPASNHVDCKYIKSREQKTA